MLLLHEYSHCRAEDLPSNEKKNIYDNNRPLRQVQTFTCSAYRVTFLSDINSTSRSGRDRAIDALPPYLPPPLTPLATLSSMMPCCRSSLNNAEAGYPIDD